MTTDHKIKIRDDVKTAKTILLATTIVVYAAILYMLCLGTIREDLYIIFISSGLCFIGIMPCVTAWTMCDVIFNSKIEKVAIMDFNNGDKDQKLYNACPEYKAMYDECFKQQEKREKVNECKKGLEERFK